MWLVSGAWFPFWGNVLSLALQFAVCFLPVRLSTSHSEIGEVSPSWHTNANPMELVVLTVATLSMVATLPAAKAMRRAWHSVPLRFLALVVLLLSSVSGLCLSWFNAFQEEYYFQDCYSTSVRVNCPLPRYRWVDVIYAQVFRDTCVMRTMGSHQRNSESPEHVCYKLFEHMLPICIKGIAGSLLLASLIGASAVYDSNMASYGQKQPDEADVLHSARMDEYKQGGSSLCVADRGFAALGDG